MDKEIDLEEQYDKIYRYCYFKVHRQETAEDITQETFLRFLESETYQNTGKAMHYLYTIARNLCIDEYRKKQYREVPWEYEEDNTASGYAGSFGSRSRCDINHSGANGYAADGMEERLVDSLALQAALAELEEEERELLLLRYANEVPAAVIGRLLGISRFAVHRRLKGALGKLQEKMGKME